jgi:hypothetical protein
MTFSRCLLSSALLAGVVFCGSTFPLAALGSKPVTIQLGEQQVFVGRIKEFAGPYLGFATAISIGVGAVSLATAGWQQSSRKLGKVEEQMSTLKQQLQEKEALLEDLKFSESRLNASGLQFFLQDEAQSDSPAPAQLVETRHAVIGTMPPSVQPTNQPIQPKSYLETPTVPPQSPQFTLGAEPIDLTVSAHTKAQAATVLSSAQAFMGFARPVFAEEVDVIPPVSNKLEDTAQLNELLSHLKQVMTQLETLNVSASEPSEHVSANWQQHKLAS